MAEHTPGPWRFDGGECVVAGEGWDSPIVADLAPHNAYGEALPAVTDDDDTLAANGRLIAAAPELLAACRAVLDEDHGTPPSDATLRQLIAAVAKATGE